jgi:phospholipid-translocating ATPase
MVFASVFASNFFNGLNTSAWTGWVFFAVFLGDVLLLVYTVCGHALDYLKVESHL